MFLLRTDKSFPAGPDCRSPEVVMGEKITAFSKTLFGEPTWPIVSRSLITLINSDHLHWTKWEVYDINSYDNPGVNASHYHTTAMGLYSFVTKEQFLDCMKSFGKSEYNRIRHLAPHVMMELDNGFVMPNGVLHSPTNLCTHELHVTMDEHFLAEDLTLDGVLEQLMLFTRVERKITRRTITKTGITWLKSSIFKQIRIQILS